MKPINDGGPAFPGQPFATDSKNWSDGSVGMSLRDWFAGMALQALIASPGMAKATYDALPDGAKPCDEFARVAYCVADSMLSARERKEDA